MSELLQVHILFTYTFVHRYGRTYVQISIHPYPAPVADDAQDEEEVEVDEESTTYSPPVCSFSELRVGCLHGAEESTLCVKCGIIRVHSLCMFNFRRYGRVMHLLPQGLRSKPICYSCLWPICAEVLSASLRGVQAKGGVGLGIGKGGAKRRASELAAAERKRIRQLARAPAASASKKSR